MANDPFADFYNTMGVQGMIGPNPYLQYQGQIPMAGYMGTPTDASGKPIQSFLDAQAAHDAWQPPVAPGTTLNTPPAASANPLTKATGPGGLNRMGLNPNAYGLGLQSGQSPMNPSGNAALFASNWGGFMPTSGQWGGTQQPAAPAAPATPTNPIDMRQAYLSALSNPGKVTTPGAVMQPGAAPTGGPQPSVLNAFLASHPSGGTQIPGGYGNEGFFSTLQNLQAQKGGATS
jgi:hypothetical protein